MTNKLQKRDYQSVDATLAHVQEITGTTPTLSDLMRTKDLWETIRQFWLTLYEEEERQNIGYQTIRVIDFDIIYPAFWTTRMPSDPFVLTPDLSFPMTAHLVFKYTKKPFTIPPGAVFELARYLVELEDDYGITQTKLRDTLRRVGITQPEQLSQDAGQIENTLNALEDAGRESLEQLDRLIVVGARLKRLRRILRHEHYQPWDDVMKDIRSATTPREVKRIWNIFNERRPRFTMSNYLDALNMASYYSLLRTQIVERGGTMFPLMASGTPIVLNFDEYPSWLRSRRSMVTMDSIKPVSPQYLSFATVIETYTESNSEALHTHIREGIDQIDRLLSEWRGFWADCRRYFFTKSKVSADELALSELLHVPSFLNFCSAYNRWKSSFVEIMGTTFIDVSRADRQLSETHRLMKGSVVKEILSQASEAETGADAIFDWNRKTSAVDTHLVLQPELHDSALTVRALRSPRLTAETIVQELAQSTPEGDGTFAIRVFLPHVGETLFTWERSHDSLDQLVYWQHSLDLGEALSHVQTLVTQIENLTGPNPVTRFEVFSEDHYGTRDEIPAFAGEDWLQLVLQLSNEPEYLIVETEKCTVFLDAVPFDEDATLEVAVMYEEDLHKAISEFRQKTASTPFAPLVIEFLLREYCEKFQSPGWVEQMISGGGRS